jgi:hypothetical protein
VTDYFVGRQERPARKMPSALNVAKYHGAVDPDRLRDGHGPACMGCSTGADEWSQLERAHLIDRCFGGLDGPQNIVMLCRKCHRSMPSFEPGREDAAWSWVRTRESWYATFGRLVRAADALLARIIQEHGEGRPAADIAAGLNRDGVPTFGGGTHDPSPVQEILDWAADGYPVALAA